MAKTASTMIARKHGVVIGRQHELQREQQRDHGHMQRRGLADGAPAPAFIARAPNRPCGRKTSTSATSSVASDLGQRRREEDRDDAVGKADEQGRDHRAAQGAEAADDDDDEGQEQRVAAHQIMRLLDRHDQHRGDRRQHGAEREDAGIDAVDRDAEGLRRLAVILGGAHDEADAGAGQHEPDGEQHQHRRRR